MCLQCSAVNRVSVGKRLTEGKCGKCSAPLAADAPVDVTDKVYAKLRAKDQGALALDVWAPWCGPCKMMAPAYAAAAQKFAGHVRFVKLNSQQYPNAAQDLNIRGIPALFIFNNGKLVSQKSGALPEEVISSWVASELSL